MLDVNLPGLSGFEVLKAIRSNPEMVRLPGDMFSSSSASSDRAQANELGCGWLFRQISRPGRILIGGQNRVNFAM